MNINKLIIKFLEFKSYPLFSSIILVFFATFFFTNNNIFSYPSSAQVSPRNLSFFRASPRLTRSVTTFSFADVISTYIFEIEIPQNAGNNLQKIIINQQKNTETITFFPDKTKVFILNQNQKPLDVNSTLNVNNNQNEIIINLSQPANPGDKIRLAIKAKNPLYGGIYQFGITVYPEGNNPQSLYLGIARFHFNMRGDRF